MKRLLIIALLLVGCGPAPVEFHTTAGQVFQFEVGVSLTDITAMADQPLILDEQGEFLWTEGRIYGKRAWWQYGYDGTHRLWIAEFGSWHHTKGKLI